MARQRKRRQPLVAPSADFDGAILTEFKVEGGTTLVKRQTQPERERILARNRELRRNPGALRNLSFAGLELTIPMLDLHALQKKYPDLKATDAATRRNAWLRFMGSDEADIYRVNERSRARKQGDRHGSQIAAVQPRKQAAEVAAIIAALD